MIDGLALSLSSDQTLRERLEPALLAVGDLHPMGVVDPVAETTKA